MNMEIILTSFSFCLSLHEQLLSQHLQSSQIGPVTRKVYFQPWCQKQISTATIQYFYMIYAQAKSRIA